MTTELDETVIYPIPGPHDRRCELSVGWLRTRAKTCRCERRRIVRNLSLELGNVHIISDEAMQHAALGGAGLLGFSLGRQMGALEVALAEHDRELIPSSLTVTSTHDAQMDCTAVRVEVLTLPTGILHDKAVLEVAADWVARKWRLRS